MDVLLDKQKEWGVKKNMGRLNQLHGDAPLQDGLE